MANKLVGNRFGGPKNRTILLTRICYSVDKSTCSNTLPLNKYLIKILITK